MSEKGRKIKRLLYIQDPFAIYRFKLEQQPELPLHVGSVCLATPRYRQVVDVSKNSRQQLFWTPNHILVGDEDPKRNDNDSQQGDYGYHVLHLHHILVVSGQDEQAREKGPAHKDNVPVMRKGGLINTLNLKYVHSLCNHGHQGTGEGGHVSHSRTIRSTQSGFQLVVQFVEVPEIQLSILRPTANAQHARFSFQELQKNSEYIYALKFNIYEMNSHLRSCKRSTSTATRRSQARRTNWPRRPK